MVFNSFRETALWQGECLELYVSCLLVPKCHRLNRFPTNDDLKKDSRCFVGFETYVPKMNLSVENGSSSSRHAVTVSS